MRRIRSASRRVQKHKIETDPLSVLKQKIGDYPSTDVYSDHLLEQLDSDKDGKISKEEFWAAISAVVGIDLTVHQKERLFKTLDRDSDGNINKDELKASLTDK